ncbi:phosphotransferase family protein [Rhodotorula paludigena]|uniref:phosphotransferase family protein n=1 Tax=Rhodotorula paludigena TaxID=86838 RepID=UPI00317BF916
MFWEEVAVVKRIEWNGLDMVVKYGRKVSEVEAEVLKMGRSETAAPVPKVYGVARDGDEVFIYQELINGRTLYELWPSTDSSTRGSLLCDLVHHLNSLHALRPPSPATPLGALVAPPDERLSRLLRLDAELASDPIVCGSAAFRDWIALELKRRTRDVLAADVEKLIDALIPLEQTVGLVHSDMHGGNVIVRDGHIVALIDFEYAAWAPPDIAAAVCGSEARQMAWTPFVTFLQRSA